METKDIKGLVYGRLTVLEHAGSKMAWGRKRVFWHCRCECGTECEVASSLLQSGITQSCGCLKRHNIASLNLTHGESHKTKENRAWLGMRSRCYTVGGQDYHLYGGRGIKMCDRWFNSYSAFLEDMGRAPSSKHSIERINVNGDYEPDNCKWATDKEQQRNKRNTRMLEYNGERKPLLEWAEILGIRINILHHRLNRKWTVERTLTQPLRKPRQPNKKETI